MSALALAAGVALALGLAGFAYLVYLRLWYARVTNGVMRIS